ncbi:phosphatase PAP2 family protein [Ramlibacter ginsenosidimutans]|nr:phosphatase PAP2 family protein [Ramlibacter ginsenosidimutans]
MKSNNASPLALSWTGSLLHRLQTLWLLKMTGTIGGIWGFFLLYFWTQESRATHAVTVPMTAVDHWVGVSQSALLPYASLWVYVALAPALARDLAGVRKYVSGALIMAFLGLATYWFFPTTTPAFGVHWSDYPALQVLKTADRGGNAFPSLHVAFAVYSGAIIAGELRSISAPPWVRGASWLWCAAIVYSTLATRQHVAIDVAGGLVVAAVALLACGSRAMTRLIRADSGTQAS